MNNRRKLVVALGVGAISWAGAARAQAPAKARRIGLLTGSAAADTEHWYQAFRLRLRDLGWIEGKNIGIEYRYAAGNRDRLPEFAAEFARLKMDVIVTTATPAALAAQKATKTIPIVMASSGDPVAAGLIESLARPGGNITGLSQMAGDLAGKRLEMLAEMVPKLTRVAVLRNPQGGTILSEKELQLSAQRLGVTLHSLEVRSSSDFDQAFAEAIKARPGALYAIATPVIVANLKRIAEFAIERRLPSIFQYPEYADTGGLMAYGPDRADMFRRAATFVDKILKGAKPADLPVEQPIRFELVLNMKTAKAIGITIPQTILVRADRVIE